MMHKRHLGEMLAADFMLRTCKVHLYQKVYKISSEYKWIILYYSISIDYV